MTLPTRRFPTVGERFKRLLGALLGQTCVPFLGAGISRPAKLDESLPEGAAAWGEAPHGNSMNRKLAFAVLDDARGDARWWAHVDSVASKRLPRDPLTREILPPAAAPLGGFDVREALLLRLEAVERDGVVRHVAAERRTRRARSARRRSGLRARLDVAERALPLWYRQITVLLSVSSPLATLSELLASRRGYVALCETLHLHAFVHIRPTAAHMAIARLLAERRVREVITTNYDTALERATEELSGSGARALDVVRTATEYMGRRSDGPGSRPVCYKINGCAGEWAGSRQTEAGRDEVARRMILTERQLQTLERSRWADGLVRDRAREAHLIFSGFGTEEPQIRHTVLAIAQEFEVGVREPTSDGDIWSLGAAPWLHAFDPALTFFQMQVLRGWQLAWRREPDPNEPENWFGAEDRRAFLLGDRQGLTADSFWITVLLGLWGRIATRAWAADGPLRAAVTDGGGEGEQRRVAELEQLVTRFTATGERDLVGDWAGKLRERVAVDSGASAWPEARFAGPLLRQLPFDDDAIAWTVTLLATLEDGGDFDPAWRLDLSEARSRDSVRIVRRGAIRSDAPGRSHPIGALEGWFEQPILLKPRWRATGASVLDVLVRPPAVHPPTALQQVIRAGADASRAPRGSWRDTRGIEREDP